VPNILAFFGILFFDFKNKKSWVELESGSKPQRKFGGKL